MGRYIVWEDIVDRYSQLQNTKQGIGSFEANSAYIQYAEAEIDALLAPVFTVPFSSNNATVRDLAIDFSYCRMGRFKIEDTKALKEELMEKINMLKSGEMAMLTDSYDALSTNGGPVWSTTKDYHPVFGHGDILDFQVDSSLIQAEEDAR